MPSQTFYLLGQSPSSAKQIEVDASLTLDALRLLIAAHFAIVEPSEIEFQGPEALLTEVSEILAAPGPVPLTIDGHEVRDPPCPKELPFVGTFFQVYPDHLGNHQRLFESLGPVVKTNNMGRATYQTNDPRIAATPSAGVFLGDTDTPEWKVTHKFLPPALGPKAVRHYAPTMQKTVEDSFKVFDELDRQGEAWNVYQYMLKMGSQAVGKLTLGIDFQHFDTPDAPVHEMVHNIAEMLSLNKKVTSKGDWYSSLPFGDPKRLRQLKARIEGMVEESMEKAAQGGIEDLPLQDAALSASNMVAWSGLWWSRPAPALRPPALSSWLIYSLVTYDGMQERLLQELVDHGFDENTEMTADFTDKLEFLDKFIKETQRRHNPSFQPGRTAKVDLILPGGYKLPKDAVIIPALHHIHNNAALWDNPARFNPDRWDTEEVKIDTRRQVKVFLPKLVYRYKFSREGDGPIEYDPMFQLIRPNNLYVRAEKRTKWPGKSRNAV
ncbi:hypothetical protein N7470_005583 [Penicillium chermesinum]|nr:hypothetical protein N7470_005583 [Penicillium chermesinum]